MLWTTLNVVSLAFLAFGGTSLRCCGRQVWRVVGGEGRERFCWKCDAFWFIPSSSSHCRRHHHHHQRAMLLAVSHFSENTVDKQAVAYLGNSGGALSMASLFVMGHFAPFSNMFPFYKLLACQFPRQRLLQSCVYVCSNLSLLLKGLVLMGKRPAFCQAVNSWNSPPLLGSPVALPSPPLLLAAPWQLGGCACRLPAQLMQHLFLKAATS